MKYDVSEYTTKRGSKGLIISVADAPVVSMDFEFRAGTCLSFGCGCDCQGAANLSSASDREHHEVVAQRYAATYLISVGAGCRRQWDCRFRGGLIFRFLTEFWHKMLLCGLGVYLPYFVIDFSR